jgi:hypothetical protein
LGEKGSPYLNGYIFIDMKIIVTEKQLGEIRRFSQYENKEAEKLFDTYKGVVSKMMVRKLKGYGENDDKVELYDKDMNVIMRYKKVNECLYYDHKFIGEIEELLPNLMWMSNEKYFVEYVFNKYFPDYNIKSVVGANIV